MSNGEIHAEHLKKTYQGTPAVEDVSFSVRRGEVFGFLGPNGAGKSTTVAMLTTLSLPTAGKAAVGGFDVVREPAGVRRVCGVALQEIGLDPLMTARELLELQCGLFGRPGRAAAERSAHLLDLVKLGGVGSRRVGTFSGGMKRRLDLAMALAHEPDILFLDEPTTGLDPASRRDVWAEVRRLNREQGMTIFLTTQYLEEADALADRIAIIDQGRIVQEGTPKDLKEELGAESINIVFPDAETAERARSLVGPMAEQARLDRTTLRLYLPRAANAVASVVDTLNRAQLSPDSLTLSQPTLDDVFLRATGQRFEPGTPHADGALGEVG